MKERFCVIKGFLGTYVVMDRNERDAFTFCYNKEDATEVALALNLLERYKGEIDD